MFKKVQAMVRNRINKLKTPNQIARQMGVQFGKGSVFRSIDFGSEPYLIKMGENVSVSCNVTFITHDGAVRVLINKYEEYKDIDLLEPIILGSNIFIGANTTLLAGTKVGSNVIIGAGSLVKGELKADSVYAGVPARYICSLDEYKEKNHDAFEDVNYYPREKKKEFLLNKFQKYMEENSDI